MMLAVRKPDMLLDASACEFYNAAAAAISRLQE